MDLITFENAQTAYTTLADRVAQIGKSSRKLDALIHETLVMLLVHIRDHGDTTLLTRLFASLPNGSRLKTYFVWCEKFAPLKVSKAKDTRGQVTVAKGRTTDDFLILEAMAIAPWDLAEHKNPTELKVLTFEAIVKWVSKQAKKSISAGKFNIDQVRALSDRVAADLIA